MQGCCPTKPAKRAPFAETESRDRNRMGSRCVQGRSRSTCQGTSSKLPWRIGSDRWRKPRRLSRAQLVRFLGAHEPAQVVMEACGTRCVPGRQVRARRSGQARPTCRLECAPCRRRMEAEEAVCRGIPAAASTRFIANAVFRIDGRPATSTRSPRCRPAVLRSNSVNPVGTPVMAFGRAPRERPGGALAIDVESDQRTDSLQYAVDFLDVDRLHCATCHC